MMKTIGESLGMFNIIGVKPGILDPNEAFFEINEKTYAGKWKIIVFYPKDFTFVCPTEIVGYDNLNDEFEKRNAILLMGSTDNEFCKLAWKQANPLLNNIKSVMFADTKRGFIDEGTEYYPASLSNQLGIFASRKGAAWRATFITDENDVIQHVTVNNMNVGRNPEETLRVLDALQTGELEFCNRPIGGF